VTRGRIIALIVIAGLAVAAALTRGFGLLTPKTPETLVLNGNVDIRQVDLGFRIGGRIDAIPFEEGARVSAGVLLASIDTRPLLAQLAADEAQIASAGAQLEKLRNGNRPQDIAQAEAKLADARSQLAKAKADFDRRSSLVANGWVSKADFDNSKAGFGTADAQVKAAEEALSLQRVGARYEDVEAAVAQQAQATAQRDKTKTDIADADLRAPNDGVILTRAREPGAIVQPGEAVLTLTIDRPMRVRAYIDETDLSRISPGMTVEVSTDGVAKTYHGTVGFISPTAEFTPKTVQTRELRTDLVYRIRVIVDDPDDALRQGQPVTVKIPAARPAQRS
jgi:HlyD family secretion protein